MNGSTSRGIYTSRGRKVYGFGVHGKHIGTIVMPEQPANLTSRYKDHKTLYITATTSVYRLRIKAEGVSAVPMMNRQDLLTTGNCVISAAERS